MFPRKDAYMDISFKAHFTNNVNLKKLISESTENRYLKDDCKNYLSRMPQHELTISSIIGERGNYTIEVINCHSGQKTIQVIHDREPLVPLIKRLTELGSKFFNEEIIQNYGHIISILTNPKF